MKALASLALLVALAANAFPKGGKDDSHPLIDLTAGRYAVKVSGLLTRTCESVVASEVSRLPEVEKAGADLERDEIYVVVRLGKTLRASVLRKALARASKRVNLGSPIEIEAVRYQTEIR